MSITHCINNEHHDTCIKNEHHAFATEDIAAKFHRKSARAREKSALKPTLADAQHLQMHSILRATQPHAGAPRHARTQEAERQLACFFCACTIDSKQTCCP